MAKTELHAKAVLLRKDGNSYRQIRSVIPVSKGTLSLWLRDYPLSPERMRALRDWNEQRIEHYRETRRRKREDRLKEVYAIQKRKILNFSKRDLFIAGLFLYWGEGTKVKLSTITITNTDPAVPRFFIRWLREIFDVPQRRLYVRLHLYSDMDIKKKIEFWSSSLSLPKTQFVKPYIKTSKAANLTRKGGFGHGTCSVSLNDARLAEKVLLGVQVIRDHYGP